MAKLYAKAPDGSDALLSIVITGFTQSLQQNGWCKLPNGLLFQWGYTSENNKVIKFPIDFISSVYSITATITSTYGDARSSAENANKSNFFIACRNSGGYIVANIPNYWMASGN